MLLCLVGCASLPQVDGHDEVSQELLERTGAGLAPLADPPALPPDVDPGDGLDEAELVALALWTDPDFAAVLADLDLARAQLLQAGLIRDPVLSLLFPLGPKQFEANLSGPLEDLWLRPRRIDAARLDAERVARGLVRHGLDLVRDVRAELYEWERTRRQAELDGQLLEAREELARLAGARLEAGDVGPLEVSRAEADAARAAEVSRSSTAGAALARARLDRRFGDPDIRGVELHPRSPEDVAGTWELDEQLGRAFAARPELRAAELTLQAAGERLGLAEREAWKLSAILDVNGSGKNGFEAGPGLAITLPVFSGSRAAEATAQAQLEGASQGYLAVRRRIALEVEQALLAREQAAAAAQAWRERVLPALREAQARSERALEAGELTRAQVLLAGIEVLDARRRQVELEAALLRAHADLERSVGHALRAPSPDPSGDRTP